MAKLNMHNMTEHELWKDIPGYEDQYQASTYGRVRSKDMIQQMISRWGRLRNYNRKGIIKKTKVSYNGYVLVSLKHAETHHVGRLVALTFVDGYSDQKEVNHKDGNKQNNRPSNLEWVSGSENQRHRYDVLKKMPPSQIDGFRRANHMKKMAARKHADSIRSDNGTYKELASKYNVSINTIWRIKNEN